MALGVLLMLGLDEFYLVHDWEAVPLWARCMKSAAVSGCSCSPTALHNLPEAWPSGVSFLRAIWAWSAADDGDCATGHSEGLAIALALRSAGVTAIYSVLIAAASGLSQWGHCSVSVWREPAVANIRSGWGSGRGHAVCGVARVILKRTAMVADQCHARPDDGFALMMVLDTTLG